MKIIFPRLLILIYLGIVGLISPTKAQLNIYEAILIGGNLETTNISTQEIFQILTNKSATVFDVCTFQEYSISHIPGALNVEGKPGTTREAFTSDIDKIKLILGGNKEAPIVLYCAGIYCGKGIRVADDLVEAGYDNIRRYQLGIPVWRALGKVTEIELEGIQFVYEKDKTAVFIDARDVEQYNTGSLDKSVNLPASLIEPGKGGPELIKAKKDGRLPMEDHNTRIIVFGQDKTNAKVVAEALTKNAFHNVSYFPGKFEQIRDAIK